MYKSVPRRGPSWPWALPLYIRSQLPHSLDLTYSPMFPARWRSFFLLEKHINFFFCLSDTSLFFKTSGFVGRTELQANRWLRRCRDWQASCECVAFFRGKLSLAQASSAAQGAWFAHAFTRSAKLCFITVCDCTDARATVLMADNCLNEIFQRNTIPGGMKAVPPQLVVDQPLADFREEQLVGFWQLE